MEFNNKWCELVKEYIDSPSFSIIINEKTSTWFQSNCGIRHGDPMSSYLFLFRMLLLDLEINQKLCVGKLEGSAPNKDVEITIISYVDDLLIVSKATLNNYSEILDSLDKFKKWTGLKVNDKKSNVMISPGLHPRLKIINLSLNFNEANHCWKHLGIHISSKCIPKADFE